MNNHLRSQLGTNFVIAYVLHGVASDQSRSFVMFSFWNSGHQWGCTVADVPAQQPVEHLKNALQNITTDRTPHSVDQFWRLRINYWLTSHKNHPVPSPSTTMRASFYTLIVALVALDIQKVSSLSCPRPCYCNKRGIVCCKSGEWAKDVCGCCDVCAKVVC